MAKLFDYGRSYKEPSNVLRVCNRYPCLEYIQKAGLNKLADEIISSREYSQCFDCSKKKLNEVLKLDKQRYNRLKTMNGGSRTLYLLQQEQKYGGKITKAVPHIRLSYYYTAFAPDGLSAVFRKKKGIFRDSAQKPQVCFGSMWLC